MSETLRAEFTAGLRALADWFDQHPEMDLPYEATPRHYSGGVSFTIGIHGTSGPDDDLLGRFAEAVKSLGGARTKVVDDGYMRVTRKFGPGVNVEVWAERDKVCEAVVVGTETVEVVGIIREAETEMFLEERDIIEWRCASLLEVAAG